MQLRYDETNDWGTEYFKADDKNIALNLFAIYRRIPTEEFNNYTEWKWKEGVWSAVLRSINEIKEIPCSHCHGTGVIHI